jgi:hypothetical protein
MKQNKKYVDYDKVQIFHIQTYYKYYRWWDAFESICKFDEIA